MAIYSSNTVTFALTNPTNQVIVLSPSPPNSFIDKILLSYDGNPSNIGTIQLGFSAQEDGSSPIYIRTINSSFSTNSVFVYEFLSEPLFVGNSMLSLVINIVPSVASGNMTVTYNQFTLSFIHDVTTNLTKSMIGSHSFIASASPQSVLITNAESTPIRIKSWYSMFTTSAITMDKYCCIGNSTNDIAYQVLDMASTEQQSLNSFMTIQKAVLNPSERLTLFTNQTIVNPFTLNYLVTYTRVS